MTFTGTYPAAITREGGRPDDRRVSTSGVANAIVNTATTTSISLSVYVWAPVGMTGTGNGRLANNPVFVTLSLGK